MAQLKEREEAKTVREHLPGKREKSKKRFISRSPKKSEKEKLTLVIYLSLVHHQLF